MSPDHGGEFGDVLIVDERLLDEVTEVSVGVQYTMEFDDETVVDPDLVLMRPDTDPGRGLRPADVLLLIEVADTSLRTDRGEKALRYARAGIGEYWIVDVEGRRLLILREPGETGYAREDEVGSRARPRPPSPRA
jgi:Uma2 family endonuclease